MRPQTKRSAARARVRAAAGGVLAIPAIVAAPVTGAPSAQAAPTLQLSDPTPVYGEPVKVTGRAAREDAGKPVALQFGQADGGWTVLRTASVRPDGRYSFTVELTRSGSLRAVVGAPAAAQAAAAQAPAGTAARRVAVAAALDPGARQLGLLAPGTATVSGRLQPGKPGRTVSLQRRVGRAWRTLDTDRTSADGSFSLRHRVTSTGSHPVRLWFAGDGENAAAAAALGRLSGFRRSVASYYTLYGGALACGGRLGYDSLVVAHRSLPCGTPVTVRYRGRTVHARVMDRGPFHGSREFDLAGAVARKLGFSGVQTIWVAVGQR